MKILSNFKEEEFIELYNRTVPKLLAFAYKWSDDSLLAEDLVQEVFAKLWQKRHEISLDDSIDALLYTMLRNRLINAYQRQLQERVATTNFITPDAEPLDQESTDETILKIEQYIEELPPRCKEVFLMSKRDGLTYQEIASELSLSIKSVEKHISKALKILRKRFGQAYFYFF